VAAQPAPKVRGGWLTAMLIIIVIHAIFTAVLLISYHKNPGVTREVLWAGSILVALLEIASAVVMWFWKKWGLYLFVAATLASIGFGLVIYPSMLVAFHAIIPLGILAYILQAQNKLKLFE
jgi:hypothetical protein